MSTISRTVRSLAARLARDENLRARLVAEPETVLEEWGIPADGDVVPATVTLPAPDELDALVSASAEPPHERRPEEPEIHFGEGRPEIHLGEEPEVHFGEGLPEVHFGEEPEVHGTEEPEVHGGEEPEVHGGEEPEVHGAEPEVHGAEPEVHGAVAD
jgi:hypothetical protein